MRQSLEGQNTFLLPETEVGSNFQLTYHGESPGEVEQLRHNYHGDVRAYLCDGNTLEYLPQTLAFLERYDQPQLCVNGSPQERLSFGTNQEGDIFCLMTPSSSDSPVTGQWHSIFSGAEKRLTLTEERVTYNTQDLQYRYRGGDPQKRQLRATLPDGRQVRFILSGQGNRYQEIIEPESSESYPEQQLSSCLILRHQILYDQKRRTHLAAQAIKRAA